MEEGFISKLTPRVRGARGFLASPRRLISRSYWRRRWLALWACRPRTLLHWLSVLVLWGVLGFYFVGWVRGYWSYLTNIDTQADDVRTALFPFHRYGPEHALKDDPIANEMLTYIPWFVKGVFRVSVPFVGLFAACKVSQAICIGVILLGGLLIATRRRTGIAAAGLLVFLFLRDTYVLERIASGLPRGYGYPVLALWAAGALAHSVNIRRAALVLGALSYPTALAMGLAAEGVLVTSGLFRHRRTFWLRSLRSFALTLVISVVAVLPAFAASNAQDGRLHTLAEAQKDPAFGKKGRLYILPFADARTEFGQQFAKTFSFQGDPPLPEVYAFIKPQASAVAMAAIALLMVVCWVGLSPLPRPAIAFFAATSILYCLACFLAFRLYSPERYYSYGIRAAGILFCVNVMAFVGYRLRGRMRYVVRNFAAAATVLALWVCFGDGIKEGNGQTINRRWFAPLYEYVSKLPVDVRIASYPSDGDDIPYFAARATMGGYETLQPWLTGSWARQKQRAEDAITAMYATSPKAFLDYADKNGVTHVLVNSARYGKDYVQASVIFEPLTTFAKKVLSKVKPKDMLFEHPPEEAVLFSFKTLRLLSVEKLREAWAKAPAPSEPAPTPEPSVEPEAPVEQEPAPPN